MSYVQVRFPDRLQNNSMLPYHATNKKKACISMDRQQEPIGRKLVLEFFVKIYLCNSIGLFVSPAFLFLYSSHLQQLPLKRLALINQSYFN